MVKITFPRCIYCNSIDAFKCPVCKVLVCIECFHDYDSNGNCMHSRYEAPPNTGWIEEDAEDVTNILR